MCAHSLQAEGVADANVNFITLSKCPDDVWVPRLRLLNLTSWLLCDIPLGLLLFIWIHSIIIWMSSSYFYYFFFECNNKPVKGLGICLNLWEMTDYLISIYLYQRDLEGD